jgi:O-antigen ligase
MIPLTATIDRAHLPYSVVRFCAVAGVAACLGLIVVMLTDASPAYLVLLLGAVGLAASAFWFRDLSSFLVVAMVATATITINKAVPMSPMAKYGAALVFTAHEVFFFPLVALWLFQRCFVARQSITAVPGQRWALIFVAYAVFSALISADVALGLASAAYYIKYYILFLLFADLFRRPEMIRLVLYAMWLGLALQCLMAFAQFTTRSPLSFQGAKVAASSATNLVFADAGGQHAFRPFGFLLHPNVFACYLVYMLLPMGLLLLACADRLTRPLFWVIAGLFLAGFGCLVVSLSRGGWIAFGVAMIIAIAIAMRRRLVSTRQVARLNLVAALGVALTLAAYPTVLLRLTKSDNRSTEVRLLMNDQAMLMISENPILGVGLGSYSDSTPLYIPKSFGNISEGFREQLEGAIVHNKFLLTLAEGGALGLLISVCLFTVMLRHGYRAIGFKDPLYATLALGVTASIIGQVVFYNFDHFMLEGRQVLLWSHFGMLSGLACLQREQVGT